MFDQIPSQPPSTPLLDQIQSPLQLREFKQEQLPQLAEELRHFLLYTVGQTGGHFGAGLGVVELTIALHYVYNTPDDRLVWDVGHQCYPHKILTERRDRMATLRQADGLSGFPKRSESGYDTFGVGHSSTSISAALGMALAARAQGLDRKTVAVIGDGAMTAGMAFEALNHAAHTGANMLVILNDNQMSIGHNQGGLATYFAKIWSSKLYTSVREGGKRVLAHIPPAFELAKRTEEHMKGMVAPGTLFEELGFNYIGPIDGHDIDDLITALSNMRELEGPQLLHVMTQKGKGFAPAEADPVGYHAITKIEPKAKDASPKIAKPAPRKIKYQDVFGQWLCDMAAADERLIGITPAMCEGSGMVQFAQQFTDRFHDVAIAEQHAVTFAAGLACDGMKPVVAIYSTFLQRAYDQLIHDVALQNLDVTFGIDRAGLVGEDGPTHTGAYDLTYLRCVPNMIIMAPSDENETRLLLSTGYHFEGPAAVRYPRGTGPGALIDVSLDTAPLGKAVIRRHGAQMAILAFGTVLTAALEAGNRLNATVVDMRFVKPLDAELLEQLSASCKLIVTVEENTVAGGAGSGVNEYFNERGIVMPVLNLGLPDHFIEHGKQSELQRECALDADGIETSISLRWQLLFGATAKPNAI
jgi:1-deoxy-D-xylulose-5-phosphate synthase